LKLATAKNNAQNNTLDAESIKHGIQRLLLRPEKRKILEGQTGGAVAG
jgi:hypothetical protein